MQILASYVIYTAAMLFLPWFWVRIVLRLLVILPYPFSFVAKAFEAGLAEAVTSSWHAGVVFLIALTLMRGEGSGLFAADITLLIGKISSKFDRSAI